MTAIGSIYVQVKGDTTKFEHDMTQLKSYASKSGTEVSNALNNAITPKTASKGIKALSDDLSRLAQSSKSSSAGFTESSKKIAAGLSGVSKAAGITEAQYASMIEKMLRNRALTTATSSLKTLSNAMGLTAKESRALAIQMGYSSTQADKMAGSVKNMQSRMSGAHTTAGNFTRSIGMMTAELIGFGSAIAAAYTIKELGMAIFKTGQETLVADNAYKAITGSVQAAEKEMAFLRQTSGELGLNFYTLRDGYKGFLAAAQSSKIPMDEVQKIFRSISNASAVMGLSAEKTSLVFLALEQMMSKGKVSMEEIRRQMGDSLPGAFQIGAKAMGMTVEAFDKAVSAGEVYSEDFLPKFRVAMEESFQGTIADSVKAVNKMSEAWEDAKNAMAEGGFMDSVVNSVLRLTDMLKDPETVDGLTKFATGLGLIFELSVKSLSKAGEALDAVGNDSAGFALMLSGHLTATQYLMLGVDDLALKIKEFDGGLLSPTEKLRLMQIELDKLQNSMEIAQLPFFGDSKTAEGLQLQIDKVKTAIDLYGRLREAVEDTWDADSGGSVDNTRDPMIYALENAKKTAKTIAAIEEDVMKRIAKTDDAKLASLKAQLASYKANAGQKKEIEAQLNADIQAIYDKRSAAAERSRKAALAADKAALTELDTAISSYYDDLDKYEDKYRKELDETNKKRLKASEEYAKDAANTAANIASAMSTMYGDIGLKGQENYEYQVKLLDAQAKAYKDMGVDKETVERWWTSKHKELVKQQSLDSDNFFAGVKIGFQGNQDDMLTWAQAGKNITDNMTSSMRSSFSDTLFAALKGDIDDISEIWDSFMDSMLKSLTDTVADMAVQWGIGAVGGVTGWWDTGAWEVKKDHVAVIHKGEMVVPADIASVVRGGNGSSDVSDIAKAAPSGGHEWDDVEKAFFSGTMGSFAPVAAQGLSLFSSGDISFNDLLGGLLNPGNIGSAMVAGGVPSATNEYLGMNTSKFGTFGQKGLSAAGGMLGGPIGAMLGGILGGPLGMAIGDALNMRSNEKVRDYFEDKLGFFSGNQAYSKYAEAMPDTYDDDYGGGSGGSSSSGNSRGANAGTSSPGGIGGYATGGVIDSLIVEGEDGLASVRFGEGVVTTEGMEALAALNSGNVNRDTTALNLFKGVSDLDLFFEKWNLSVADLAEYGQQMIDTNMQLPKFTADWANFGITAEEALSLISDAVDAVDISGVRDQVDGLEDAADDVGNIIKDMTGELASAVDSTRSAYYSSLSSALNVALSEQSKLEEAFSSAESNMLSAEDDYNSLREAHEKAALNARLDILKTEQSAYSDAMREAESTLSDFKRISDSLRSYQSELLTGSDSSLMPDKVLAAAKSELESAGPENIIDASNKLLAAAKDALTDPAEYAAIFAQVQSKVGSGISAADASAAEAQAQIDAAELQIVLLEEQMAYLSGSNDTLASLEEASIKYQKLVVEYQEAKTALDESKWDDEITFYEQELARLDAITNATLSVKDALSAYQSALTSAIAGGYRDLESTFTRQLKSLQSQIAVVAALANSQGYAEGGVATGPSTGYLALLHGTEIITPVNSGYAPATGTRGMDKDVVELLRVLISVVSEDTGMTRKVHRILDRVTAGSDSFQTRAEDA